MGAGIYFVDEASVRSDAHRGLTWGKIGETPVVQDSGSRFSLHVISAVSPRGDMRFSFIADRMNSKTFIAFLKKLHKDAGKPILVIVDNARYHHSKETRRYIDEQDGNILLTFLPAYSPELNPDEQVWNHAKAHLGKRSIFNKQDMKRRLASNRSQIFTKAIAQGKTAALGLDATTVCNSARCVAELCDASLGD